MRRVAILVSLALLAFMSSSGGAQVKGEMFGKGSLEELEKARTISRGHIRKLVAKHRLAGLGDLLEKRVHVDELAMAHTRYQQAHKGVPVFGGEAIVHLRADGDLFAVTDDLVSAVEADTQPDLSERAAIDLAVAEQECPACLTAEPKADLWVLRHGGRDHLVYRVRLEREDGSDDTARPVLFIDAHTGEKVSEYNDLQTATGSGSSLYSGTVSIETYLRSSNSTYYLEDISRKVGTFDNRNTTLSTYRFTDANNVWDSSSQRAGVDAHFGAEKFYDYLLNVHGRRGIDGSGGPGYYTSIDGVTKLVSSKVHYGTNYNNAFWNGSYMTYGDGDGVQFSPLVTADICGHEMQHGVTERTANLTYSGESGALNESWSDVFGAMNERYIRGENANTWLIGEDAYTPGTAGDALRYMDDPHRASNGGFTADDDPDHYSERYTGTADNGGVHINSGIANKAFYLLAKGGTHHLGGSMTGIGADKAAAIWYKALTTYMTSSTNFAGARTGTLNAAAALYGSGTTEYNAVAQAWCLVGVGSCNGGGGGAELVSNGGFEGSSSPWILSGQAYHTTTGAYPRTGSGYVYMGAGNNANGTLYQQISIPSTASGNGSFWLNVTSSETTTTTQFDKLFVEVRSTSGTLLATLATYSNLNKGTAGVYSQKSLNLSAYKGQTIRLQFRATTDVSLSTTFRIDDVSVK